VLEIRYRYKAIIWLDLYLTQVAKSARLYSIALFALALSFITRFPRFSSSGFLGILG